MRPEDVSTIFWAYLLLGDDEMYLFKIEGEESNLKRMRRWVIKEKPFYSADNIPQWAKDKLVEHKLHIKEYGVDMDEIVNWTWSGSLENQD